MTEVITPTRLRAADGALRERARYVIPGGMYGHLSANELPPEYPQFYERAAGAHVWDVDGNEYVDFMCSFGPVLLGHKHAKVEAAAAAQRAKGDTMSGPGAVMVEAAEALTSRVAHADWAMFAKNGTDATTIAIMVARAATGRSKVLVATGAYHGASPWFTIRNVGVTREDRVNLPYYTFNDLASVHEAVAAVGGELAGILVSPFRHDAGFDQELVDLEFARGLRSICDQVGAALIIDEVRGGFRLHDGGSWEPIGVAPDLSAWSKAIANGYPLAAVLGTRKFADAASRIFVTGSFWYQAVPMAACLATLAAVREERAVGKMLRIGTLLREGLAHEATNAGVQIRQTGPVQMPNLSFVGDKGFAQVATFCATAVKHGVIFHPRHNWFVSAAHTEDDVERAVAAARQGFRAVSKKFAFD
jgi:glutamate-1-semialdehyde 2,1-aminomutase